MHSLVLKLLYCKSVTLILLNLYENIYYLFQNENLIVFPKHFFKERLYYISYFYLGTQKNKLKSSFYVRWGVMFLSRIERKSLKNLKNFSNEFFLSLHFYLNFRVALPISELKYHGLIHFIEVYFPFHMIAEIRCSASVKNCRIDFEECLLNMGIQIFYNCLT